MKLGKVIYLGVFGLTLVFSKTAGAQSITNQDIAVVCKKLAEEHAGKNVGKCQDYLLACETNISNLKEDLTKENGCINRQLVDCPAGSIIQDCFEVTLDQVCVDKSTELAIENIVNTINGECNGTPPETPPINPDPKDPQEPKDPEEPKNPVPPVTQPEQPEVPTDPFQVGDNNQGQAAGGLFQLSGSGCSLNLAGAESASFLNGFWLLLPLLGLRKKK